MKKFKEIICKLLFTEKVPNIPLTELNSHWEHLIQAVQQCGVVKG